MLFMISSWEAKFRVPPLMDSFFLPKLMVLTEFLFGGSVKRFRPQFSKSPLELPVLVNELCFLLLLDRLSSVVLFIVIRPFWISWMRLLLLL